MYFIILLIVILVLIYLYKNTNICKKFENFVGGYDPNFFNPEPVNYNVREQNCDQLTYTTSKCDVKTVVPSNKIVCNKSLSPITNNDILNEKLLNKKKNNNISNEDNLCVINRFDDELKTDVKSLNSLENDIETNL